MLAMKSKSMWKTIWFDCPTYNGYLLSKVRGDCYSSTYVALICMSFRSLILSCKWIWLWYNAHFYLSTISPLMHVMIYVLTYSRTSKGLSLGELIRAFYIIIYITFSIILECYLHDYMIVSTCFRWFWGLSYKVPIFGI